MKSDINVLEIYMKMLIDGSAFSNWENPPNDKTRNMIVESILNDKSFRGRLDIHKIKKFVDESKNEEELNELLNDMLIKEEEFLV